MSVVGPRPMILAEYDQIQARDRYGANDIRPGLTGWAQVNGRDGVTVEWREKVSMRSMRIDDSCPYCKNRKLLRGFNDLAPA